MTLRTLAGSTSQSSEGIQDYNSDLTDGVGVMHNRLGQKRSSSFFPEKSLEVEIEVDLAFEVPAKYPAQIVRSDFRQSEIFFCKIERRMC